MKSFKSVFQLVGYLSIESISMLPNLSLEMEFLGNVFTNFIFFKFLSHEALVTGRVTQLPVTIKRSFISSYK